MPRVLVVATSRKTRGGITAVIKAHETGEQWKKYHCTWIQTHRDGPAWRKILYLLTAYIEFLLLLPFCDIVHIHCAGKTSGKRKIPFAKIAHFCGKKVIIHFHPPGPDDITIPWSHDVMGQLFGIADIVITLSPLWIRMINEVYPGNTFKMKVLWNPCPVVPKREDIRKKQILYAGTILKRKGYDVLLLAFGKIAKRHPDWKLVFAGNPYLENGINEIENGRQIAEKYGITNQVEWLGWVSGAKKDRAFRESSIYCLASDGEGFPMGVLDAWAYGIPCVVTPVGGIPDVAKDGENILLFTPGDIDALATQLERMITDTALRARIEAASRQFSSTTFNKDTINKELGEIYESLVTS